MRPDRRPRLCHHRLELRATVDRDPQHHPIIGRELTTNVTIDASEFTSYTAATAAVIDSGNKDVATGDLIAIDVDAAGTGRKRLGVILTFTLP